MAKLPGQGKSPPKSPKETKKPDFTDKHWVSMATLMLGAKKDKLKDIIPDTPGKSL